MTTAEYLAERKARADLKAFDRIMRRKRRAAAAERPVAVNASMSRAPRESISAQHGSL
jgi:hypothetical protein